MSKRGEIPLWWEQFLNEWLKNGQNGTQAYLAVRPKCQPRSAEANARRLLADARFAAFRDSRMAKMSDKLGMSREKWIRTIADCAGIDIRQYLETEPETGDVKLVRDWKERADGHAIEGINLMTTTLESGQVVQRVSLKTAPKLKALEILGKALGYLDERPQISIQTGPLIALAPLNTIEPPKPSRVIDVTPANTQETVKVSLPQIEEK